MFIFIFSILFNLNSVIAQEQDSIFTTINLKNILLYENPTTSSSIIRRVFEGEVLKIIKTVQNDKGEAWGKVYLSPNQIAYLQAAYFNKAEKLVPEIWMPEQVLRSQMPVSFALKGPSELFGAGLQFRYLPFARFGFTAGVGSVLDQEQMKGSSLSYGLTCMLSMANFSPFVETGSTTLTFNDTHSTLRISTFYVNAGVEWILQSGYFFGVGVSYNRSYEIQVSYDYSYAKAANGNLSVGQYGSFNSLDGASSLQRLNPLFLIGYSF
jgi:hypothetical protein